ncbi:MAG: hypothetical protein NT080_12065 [Spirochaetes bacterium]|nr:hypothetical protein [Spirochaetota bacterium]
MKDIIVLGKSYSFPEIKDERFESLQEEIRVTRTRIQEGSSERRVLGLFRKAPTLDAGQRITLMEELVDRYDELIGSLKEKIGGCTETFESVGEGVREYFNRKVAELEAMESRRAALAAAAVSAGQAEVAQGLEGERERIRLLALNLTRASVLIIRKLRHALTALETLVDDEAAQRRVLDAMKGSVSLFRKTHEFTRDLDSIERDIALMTRLALNFDTILKDNLGPLAILIDEVTRVDSRVADSLAEIEKLSAQLESKKDVSGLLGRFDDRIFDALVRARVKKDVLEDIVAAMSDPALDLGEIGFDTEVAGSGVLDFGALAANMGELVRRGLADLRAVGPPVPDAGAPNVIVPGTSAAPALEAPIDAVMTGNPAEAKLAVFARAVSAEAVAVPAPVETAAPAPAPSPVPAPAPAWISSMNPNPARPIPRTVGPYGAAISRADPALIVFLLDRSGSMEEPYTGVMNKAQYLARTVDRTLIELAVRCNKADGTRDYFHIACIGYQGESVRTAFSPPLDAGDFATISRIASSPLRLDTAADGSNIPVWIDPASSGGTPMKAAFEEACRFVATWCDAHPASYPPTVINVSDGHSTDGDPSRAADILRQLHTDDGDCLVYNLHVRSGGGAEVVFPDNARGLDEYGRLLFEMSSPFPPHILDRALSTGFRVGPGSRFFAYGAGAELVTRFFELGTRPTRLA